MRIFFALLFLINGLAALTQPLWVDDTPIYSPWIAVFVFAPINLVVAWTVWRD